MCAFGEGNGNSLQYSCLENPMDRGTWQATVHGIARNWGLDWATNTHMCAFGGYIVLRQNKCSNFRLKSFSMYFLRKFWSFELLILFPTITFYVLSHFKLFFSFYIWVALTFYCYLYCYNILLSLKASNYSIIFITIVLYILNLCNFHIYQLAMPF